MTSSDPRLEGLAEAHVATFRLIRESPGGLGAYDLATRSGIQRRAMAMRLSVLIRRQLIQRERRGRNIVYRAVEID